MTGAMEIAMAYSKAKCANKGCRRIAKYDGVCRKCAKAAAATANEMTSFADDKQDDEFGEETTTAAATDPFDAVRRLSQVELLKLGKLGAELESALMKVRLVQYEANDMRAAAEARLREQLAEKEEERKGKAADLQRVRAEYDALTLGLSKKYDIDDPKCMVVDTETGVIRDSRSI